MEDSHSSGHEADSKRGESHLAKVQGEYIGSDVTCGQPAEISAMKVFNALSRGLSRPEVRWENRGMLLRGLFP